MGRTTDLEAAAGRAVRWPWAIAATVAGAATGAAIAFAVRRVQGEDCPDAQEPEDLRAVVDRAGDEEHRTS